MHVVPFIKVWTESRPTSLLFYGYRSSFPGTKRPGREVDHSLPSSASPLLTRLHGKIYIVKWLLAKFRQTIMLKELEAYGPTLFMMLTQQLAIFIVAV